MQNTKEKAHFTLFIYPTKSGFIGVCLELDIVDNGDDLRELEARMKKSVESYVRRVCSNDKFDGSHLNRHAPRKYWLAFFRYLDKLRRVEKSYISTARNTATRNTPRIGDFMVSRQNLAAICPS